MKDRVSLHPGRVVLTPVPGQTNTYDMTMADQPTQVGDPPTKANLLSDATVAALNAFLTSALPANPKVTDAIKSLATVGLGKIAYGSYIGTGTYGASNPCSLTFPLVPKLVVLSKASTYSTDTSGLLVMVARSNMALSLDESNQNTNSRISLTWETDSVSWYTASAERQMNTSSRNYHYVAFG